MRRRDVLILAGAIVAPWPSKAGAETPIEQPTRFEMVVNANAARALALTLPVSSCRQMR